MNDPHENLIFSKDGAWQGACGYLLILIMLILIFI